MKKIDIEFYVLILLICLVLWMSTTTIIQRFKCTKMTEIELFLNMPKSLLLNFKKCESN